MDRSGRPVSPGLLRLNRSGPAIVVPSTRPSMSSFHSMLCSTPLLCLMFTLAPLVFRTRPVGFSSGPQWLGVCFSLLCVRCPLRLDRRPWTSSSTSYTLHDSNVWNVFLKWTGQYEIGTSLRRLGTFATLSQSLKRAALLC